MNKKLFLIFPVLLLVGCEQNQKTEYKAFDISEEPKKEESQQKVEEFAPIELTSLDIYNNEHVYFFGRHYKTKFNTINAMAFNYSGSGFEVSVRIKDETNSFTLSSFTTTPKQYFKVFVDGKLKDTLVITSSDMNKVILNNLPIGDHEIKFVKLNEVAFTKFAVRDMSLSGGTFLSREKSEKNIIEVYGDSVSAAYGNIGKVNVDSGYTVETQDATLSYGYLLAEDLGYEYSGIAYSGIALALSPFGDTYTMLDKYDTSDGTQKFDMSSYQPKLVVINLGTNDNTKFNSLSSVTQKDDATELFFTNYKQLVDNVKSKSANCKIIAMYNCMSLFHDNLVTAIEGTLQYANNKYGENTMFSIEMTRNNGGVDTHPDVEGHKSFFNDLKQFIDEKGILK